MRGMGVVLGIVLLAFVGLTAPVSVSAEKVPLPALSFEERVEAQRAIEEVYWANRTWPEHNPGEKPSFDEVMSSDDMERIVRRQLAKNHELEAMRGRGVTTADLQAELDRIAVTTRDGRVLNELFAALGHDPYVIAECLVRPIVVERMLRESAPTDAPESLQASSEKPMITHRTGPFSMPEVMHDACTTFDEWHQIEPSSGSLPQPRTRHTAVWTGTEVIVWGGRDASSDGLSSGAIYTPATDAFVATNDSDLDLPSPRWDHTAVWNGTEMIVWGGYLNPDYLGDGARFTPSAAGGEWQPMDATGEFVPSARRLHTAVWTGTEMIVWGGGNLSGRLATGARYDAASDTWKPVEDRDPHTPQARFEHTAVWTGRYMIVWGGYESDYALNTGGRYDPFKDLWYEVTTDGAPVRRAMHTAVWTGEKMIVWGGDERPDYAYYYRNDGGIYDPRINQWELMDNSSAPSSRGDHTAVWTGSEMIIWGGKHRERDYYPAYYRSDGARYTTDAEGGSWTPMTLVGAPSERAWHASAWGQELFIFSGQYSHSSYLRDDAFRYCAPCMWYLDADEDGFGSPASEDVIGPGSCVDPSDASNTYVQNDRDCDDGRSDVKPGAPDSDGDGSDNDCDGFIDEDTPGVVRTLSIADDIHAPVDTEITVPVHIDDATGVTGVDIKVLYDPAVLRYDGASRTPETADMDLDDYTTGDRIEIRMHTSDPLVGEMDLVNMHFTVLAEYEECCDLHFIDCGDTLNEGTGTIYASCDHGMFCADKSRFEIGGQILYYRDVANEPASYDNPVNHVTVRLFNDTLASYSNDVSENGGRYSFGDLRIRHDFRSHPFMQGYINREVFSSQDAALVARHAVHAITLTDGQQLAADTSGNGTISGYDAALIAQYLVHIRDNFPVRDDRSPNSDWIFVVDTDLDGTKDDLDADGIIDEERAYPSIGADHSDQTFFGILIGEVTGNWEQASDSPARTANARPSGDARCDDLQVALGDLVVLDERFVEAPLVATGTGSATNVRVTFSVLDDVLAVRPALSSKELDIEDVGVGLISVTGILDPASKHAPTVVFERIGAWTSEPAVILAGRTCPRDAELDAVDRLGQGGEIVLPDTDEAIAYDFALGWSAGTPDPNARISVTDRTWRVHTHYEAETGRLYVSLFGKKPMARGSEVTFTATTPPIGIDDLRVDEQPRGSAKVVPIRVIR